MNSKKFSLVIRKPINNFKKKITVDSDKSISIRSFLLGSISNGVSSVKNVLESETESLIKLAFDFYDSEINSIDK